MKVWTGRSTSEAIYPEAPGATSLGAPFYDQVPAVAVSSAIRIAKIRWVWENRADTPRDPRFLARVRKDYWAFPKLLITWLEEFPEWVTSPTPC